MISRLKFHFFAILIGVMLLATVMGCPGFPRDPNYYQELSHQADCIDSTCPPPECRTSADCPLDQVCQSSQVCTSAALVCEDDIDCPSEMICVRDGCHRAW